MRGRLAHISTGVEPETIEKLDEIAMARNVARADVLREMLRRGIESYEHDQTILREARLLPLAKAS